MMRFNYQCLFCPVCTQPRLATAGEHVSNVDTFQCDKNDARVEICKNKFAEIERRLVAQEH